MFSTISQCDLFQPARFHNLDHELVYKIAASILVIAALSLSTSVGIYYFNTKQGSNPRIHERFQCLYRCIFRQCPGGCCLLYWIRERIAKIKTRKRKIRPATAKIPNIKFGTKLVISNFIPLTTLNNLIFTFSIVTSTVIGVIQIGVPNLSIQMVVMLVCLLFSNSEAKKHCKRRYAAFREFKPGVVLVVWFSYEQGFLVTLARAN